MKFLRILLFPFSVLYGFITLIRNFLFDKNILKSYTFEIPIITLVLILIGVVSTQSLAEKRRFIVVGCFFIAMFVTPPDALSMIMLAVPMWLLFEIGLFFGKLLEKRKTTSH